MIVVTWSIERPSLTSARPELPIIACQLSWPCAESPHLVAWDGSGSQAAVIVAHEARLRPVCVPLRHGPVLRDLQNRGAVAGKLLRSQLQSPLARSETIQDLRW